MIQSTKIKKNLLIFVKQFLARKYMLV